ncbi:MAG: hypothetical protein HYW63_01405 [Candidatus Levybacteria bacterium]|nr:hypothetical protein [Candidatus Levybacteria bacterium]
MTAERERGSPGQPELGLIERSPRERAIDSYLRLAGLLFYTPDNQLNEQMVAEKILLGELINLDAREINGETIKNLSTNRTFKLPGPPSGRLLVFSRERANGVIGDPLSPENLETLRRDIQIVQSNSKDATKVVKEERWTSVETHVSQTRERLGLTIDPYRTERDVYNYWVFVPPKERAQPSPRPRQAQAPGQTIEDWLHSLPPGPERTIELRRPPHRPPRHEPPPAPAPSLRAERLLDRLRRQFERAGRETLQHLRERCPHPPLPPPALPRPEVPPPSPQYMVVIANRTSELKRRAREAARGYLKTEVSRGNIFNNFKGKVLWRLFDRRVHLNLSQKAERWLIEANDIHASIDWGNQRAVSTRESRTAEYASALGKTAAIQYQSRYTPSDEERIEINGPIRQEVVDTLVRSAVNGTIRPERIQQEIRSLINRHSKDPSVRKIFGQGTSYFATDLFVVAQQIRQDLINRRITVEQVRRTLRINFVNPHWGKEGEEVEKYEYDTRSADELLEAISLSGRYGIFNLSRADGRKLLIQSLTEIRARLDFSRRNGIDLITYRSRYEIEQGRAALERTISHGIAALEQSGITEADFREEWKRSTSAWIKLFEDDLRSRKLIPEYKDGVQCAS